MIILEKDFGIDIGGEWRIILIIVRRRKYSSKALNQDPGEYQDMLYVMHRISDYLLSDCDSVKTEGEKIMRRKNTADAIGHTTEGRSQRTD